MRKWWVIWPLYAGLMGFALGASFFFALYGRNVTEGGVTAQHEQQASSEPAKPKKEDTDEALAYYTLWLMAFTGVLAFATVGLGVATVLLYFTGQKQFRFAIRSGIRQTNLTKESLAVSRKAAEAADLSAKASVALELPFFRIVPEEKIGWDVSVQSGEESHHCFLSAVAIINAGRTKAFPTELAWGWEFGDELPNIPTYSEKIEFETGHTLRPDVADTIHIDAFVDVPIHAYDLLRGGTKKLWFYCCLSYLDFMDVSHSARFCWLRYEGFGRGQWLRDPTLAYNRKT